jgi:hypothetical protein
VPAGVHVPSHGHGYLKPVQPGEVRNPTGFWCEARDERPAMKINMSIMSPEERTLLLGLLRRGLLIQSEPVPSEVPQMDATAER